MDRTPASVLEEEHRYIQKVVGVIAWHVDEIASGRAPDVPLIAEIAEFLRLYADEAHHGKEEAVLFPALERAGVPAQGCPLGALKHEHTAGRDVVARLAGAAAGSISGQTVPPEEFARILQEVVALYPGHIWKEDYLLFPMAGKVLGDEQQEAILAGFDAADAAFGVERHRRFEEWADALAAMELDAKASAAA